ncbi:MAG: mannitol dehydrogenase family protein [Pseudomonadota bacterium]
MKRLTSLDDMASGIRQPKYQPSCYGSGIVHLGVGAFHRAHQAVYTDDALAAGGGEWRIIGVSLRSPAVADALNPQNGLYTLIERCDGGSSARVIGSLSGVIAATREPGKMIDAMTDPRTRIVSLTVTEKAYGIDRVVGGVDMTHPTITADLLEPKTPSGVIGLLVTTLRRRRDRGIPAFTIVCCDNLPNNGALLRAGVLDFTRRLDPKLADWIEAYVAFPSTMVDRITPAPTDRTRADAARLIRRDDYGAVETEAFSQWVVEERFPSGRPSWEAGGALFVDDVTPYERMKLRILNGAHSMLAYAGYLNGHTYVRDVMANKTLAALVRRHMLAAADTLTPMSGIDLTDYVKSLLKRFQNPDIDHETYQIAMDGTEKLPQRILEPAMHALEHGQNIRPFAFAVAAWMRYGLGRKDDGETYALRDPLETEIAACRRNTNARDLAAALQMLPGLFPDRLSENRIWCDAVESILDSMLKDGVTAALHLELDKG